MRDVHNACKTRGASVHSSCSGDLTMSRGGRLEQRAGLDECRSGHGGYLGPVVAGLAWAVSVILAGVVWPSRRLDPWYPRDNDYAYTLIGITPRFTILLFVPDCNCISTGIRGMCFRGCDYWGMHTALYNIGHPRFTLVSLVLVVTRSSPAPLLLRRAPASTALLGRLAHVAQPVASRWRRKP